MVMTSILVASLQPSAAPSGPESARSSHGRSNRRTILGLTAPMIRRASIEALTKLHPRTMVRNPVMFVVEVGSVLTTVLWVQSVLGTGEAPAWYIGSISLWLWFTVLFANVSESLAEGRGKAQAEALRRSRQQTKAKRLHKPHHGSPFDVVISTDLATGDVFLVEAGEPHSFLNKISCSYL